MTEATMKAALLTALAYLNVTHAGTVGNAWRWTARDLATDLAPRLAAALWQDEKGADACHASP
jgi:hypothetical protein